MNYSVIQKSQLEGALRLDAEYYQPEYLVLERILQKSRTDKIVDLSLFVKKGVFDLSPDNYQDEGIPFVRVQNIRSGFLDEESLVFIPEEVHKKEKKTELNEFDLVLSKVGTIGEISIIPNYFSKANFSQNVIGIKINKEKVPPGFLLTYLLSKFGQLQLTRAQMFQVQAKLELQDIRELQVIRLGQIENEIHQAIVEVEELFNNSKSLYSQAENLLLEELGLKDFKVEDDLSYIINLSEVKSAHRADPEYFHPKYEKLISKIKIQNAKLLHDVIENVPARFNPEPDENYRYVELANVNSSIGVIDGFSDVLGKEAPSRAKRVLKAGDVIVSSVEGSLEKVALVDKAQNGYLASTGFFQFRSKEILPEVLLALAKSPVLQMQLHKQTAGTILTAVPKEAIKNVLVSVLPKPTQQKIADLVRQSHESREKAKKLLEEAKSKVENLIERGS